jgi:hypothetical protein
MLKFWGSLDFLYLIYYTLGSVIARKSPLLGDVQHSVNLSDRMDMGLPIILTIVSLLLIVSMVVSCYSLLKGIRYGRMIVYGQLPFRLILVMPSIFFIPLLLKPFVKPLVAPHPHVTIAILMLLVVSTEGWKVITVRSAYKKQPT